MPRISRDTFNAEKNYEKVYFQIGEPALDNELNEAQDLRLVHTAENGWASAGFLRSTDLRVSAFGGLRFGAAVRNHWACIASGTPDISVRAGSIFVDGFNIILSEDISLSGEGLSFSSPGADTYGFVYADFVFAEVDSIEDPEIAQQSIGETSRRLRLDVSFGLAESTTSYAAALSGLTDLASDDYYEPAARLWKGNVARVYLCRYFRASGSSNVNQADLVDLRQDVPGEAANKHTFVKTMRGSNADGMLVWDLATSTLEIGVANGETFPAGARNGLQITTSGSPDLYASKSTDIVWEATGGGNSDGTSRTPGAGSSGWLIPDGSALGYSSAGVDGGCFPRKKVIDDAGYILTTGGASLYDVSASGIDFTLAPLLVQNLAVQPLDYFVGDPSIFVVCVRRGDDLIWFDGTVTRGNTNHPVFEELGGTPSPYSAVVGLEGKNHLTQEDAVERALNYLTSQNGTGDLGDSRSIRLFVRRGTWNFARAIHKYGIAAEVLALTSEYGADSNSLVLEGAGALQTKLQFRNPYTSDRTSTDHSVVEFAANEVTIRGLTFDQTFSGTDFLGSYYAFSGRTVVLEDCHFYGPIMVKADNVRIKNCHFYSLGNSGSSVLFPSLWAPTGFVAQHLLLQPLGTDDGVSACAWEIEGNTFNVSVSAGTQGCVELALTADLAENLRAKVTHNVWNYATSGIDCVPAINIGGTKGLIEIGHNRFIGASGVGKIGNTAAQTVPFNGLYGGAPIMRYSNDAQMYATGYISAVRGRSRTSKLHIHSNYFDLSNVGDGHSTIYALWGGVMAPFNYLTSGSSDTLEYHNIYVEKNNFMMRNSIGWNDGDGNPQPATWGFWLSPTFQDGQSLNNVQVENISVSGNNFDIGGESAANIQYCWRGILAGQITAWPASGGHLTDTSCLIGIQLKNTNAVAGNVHTGRNGLGIVISNNRVSQRRETGQSNYVTSSLATLLNLSDEAIRWAANIILIDAGGLPLPTSPVTPILDDVGEGDVPLIPTSPANSGLLFGPAVYNNSIVAPIFTQSAAGTVSNGNAAINVIGAYMPNISCNNIYMSRVFTTGIALRGSLNGLVAGNSILSYTGCYSSVNSYVGNNMFAPSPNATGGSVDTTYDGVDENFTT